MRVVAVALVAVAALVMGAPTIRGGFVGGDDHRLLLDHVLVNHPSLSHAVQLFGIIHRDLYQPLPLLSFAAEFAVANAFGLFEKGEQAGAWLFHLNNILLHAANTVLVWFLIAQLHARIAGVASPAGRSGHRPDSTTAEPGNTPVLHASGQGRSYGNVVIPTVAALLFAVHPLQMEVIAWTNGRMMLMSTLFAVASLLTFSAWLDSRKTSLGVLTLVLVLLSAISKVRLGLPVLLLIVAFARRTRIDKRLLALWSGCAAVIGIFVLVNIWSTAGANLFTAGEEHLRGPRIVRILLALAWYFQHLVWPSGLASYYPTPPEVHWMDPATGRALLITGTGFVVLAWTSWRYRFARLGTLWFFATMFSTLPLFPARNILAADRYMYLPIIGLFWLIAGLAGEVHRRWLLAWSPGARRAALATATVALVTPMIATGWHVAGFYETSLRKTGRVAALFPDTPRVWEKLGWCHYSHGNYDEAIRCAEKELRHDAPPIRSGAYQLMGMSELKLGNTQAALRLLNNAVETDPKSALAEYRLAIAYDEVGQIEEAVKHFEAAVRAAPLHNPTILRFADAYRRLGRVDDARKMYEKALGNNAYEVPAILGLAELAVEGGNPRALRNAEQRLIGLLEWMPENSQAWTHLGVVCASLDQPQDAVKAYEKALATDSANTTAALNLAQIYFAAGQIDRARPLFERAAASGIASVPQAVVLHDFFISQGEPQRAVSLWRRVLEAAPGSARARAFIAWSLALAGKFDPAAQQCQTLVTHDPSGDRDPSPAREEAVPEPTRPDVDREKDVVDPEQQASAWGKTSDSGSAPVVKHSKALIAAARKRANVAPFDSSLDASRAGALCLATLAYVDLAQGRYEAAFTRTEALGMTGNIGAGARSRLLGALEGFDRSHGEEPWAVCLAAQLLLADGNHKTATVFINVCEQRCEHPVCRQQLRTLRSQLHRAAAQAPQSPQPPP